MISCALLAVQTGRWMRFRLGSAGMSSRGGNSDGSKRKGWFSGSGASLIYSFRLSHAPKASTATMLGGDSQYFALFCHAPAAKARDFRSGIAFEGCGGISSYVMPWSDRPVVDL